MSVFFCFLFLSTAAVRPQSHFHYNPQIFRQALMSNQLDTVKSMGPEGYKNLRQVALSETEPYEMRWQAVLAMAKIGQKESRQELEALLRSKTWFLRSASLLGLSLVDPTGAQKAAKELMQKDRALLVRATALQVLSQAPQVDREFLWKELHNPLNFRKGRSLSLRTSLLQVLATSAQPSEKQKFLFLTNDKDAQIQKIARTSLQSLGSRH